VPTCAWRSLDHIRSHRWRSDRASDQLPATIATPEHMEATAAFCRAECAFRRRRAASVSARARPYRNPAKRSGSFDQEGIAACAASVVSSTGHGIHGEAEPQARTADRTPPRNVLRFPHAR
jgi:hypothetical protein